MNKSVEHGTRARPSSPQSFQKQNNKRTMQKLKLAACWIQAGALLWGAGATHAQNYPNKIVRLVTAEAAGAADFVARIIAHGLTPQLGQQVIVENRGGLRGGETAAKASADGYTLLVYGSSIWLLPFMRDNVPWNPVKDFAPITHAVSAPSLVVINPSVPAKSIRELITLVKSQPGQLNYASASAGSINHLASELFKSMAGLDIVRIPYKGTGPALTALIAGDVQMTITSAGSVAAHLKSGKLKALAITSATPSPLVPDLPTVAASGLPGYDVVSVFGVWATMGTPKPIIARLHNEIVRVLNTAEVKQKFLTGGVEVVAGTPEEFDKLIRRDMARFGKVIKDLGIRAE